MPQDRESQLAAIENTFDAAKKPVSMDPAFKALLSSICKNHFFCKKKLVATFVAQMTMGLGYGFIIIIIIMRTRNNNEKCNDKKENEQLMKMN